MSLCWQTSWKASRVVGLEMELGYGVESTLVGCAFRQILFNKVSQHMFEIGRDMPAVGFK